MSNKIGIYKIISPKGRIYIGQSNHLDRRKEAYKDPSRFKNQRRLYNSIRKYGFVNHQFIVIEICSESELNNRERYWQDNYNSCGKMGMNCKLTTTESKTGSINKSVKERIRKSLTGIKHTKERKINQSKAQQGKKIPAAHRNSISESMKKAYSNNRNLSITKGEYQRKQIEQLSLTGVLLNTFKSLREANRETDIDISSISNCCNNKRGYLSAGGYRWRWRKLLVS